MFYLLETTGDWIDLETVLGIRKLQRTWQILIYDQEPILVDNQEQVLDLVHAININSKEERLDKLFNTLQGWMEKLGEKFNAPPTIVPITPAGIRGVRTYPPRNKYNPPCAQDEDCCPVDPEFVVLNVEKIIGEFHRFMGKDGLIHNHRVENPEGWERARQAAMHEDSPKTA